MVDKKTEKKKDPTVIDTLAAMSQNMQSLNMITQAHVQLFQQATVNFKDLITKNEKLERRIKALEDGRK